jgi:phosphohistidine phosphatase
MAAQRQLIVMRHAKAGELPGGPDFERALRPRGCKNAESAGEWLAGQGLLPDLVLCSKARRARQTWQYVAVGLTGAGGSGGSGGKPEVIIDARLYEADAGQLLSIFAETDPRVRSLMYVGHNPAAAEVTEILVAAPVAFPTSAIAVIDLTAEWPEIAGGDGQLVASWTPQAQA